jgi:SAM-dependent methyltransferase
MKTAAELAAEYWDKAENHRSDRYRSWLEHPTILRYANQRVTGDPELNGVTWFQRKYLPEAVNLGLSLGCGNGDLERAALKMGIAKRFHAGDISPDAIERARLAAANDGLGDCIEYSVTDLNTATLPKNTYDLVIGMQSVHHVFQLERLFQQVRDSMRPGALFYLDEYIGPIRFQTSDAMTKLINDIRAILPTRLKMDLLMQKGWIWETYTPSPIEHFEATDPSEAIRSSEIVPLLKLYFDIVEYRPYGGQLLHMLLTGITGNFEEGNESDQALLKLFALMEQTHEAHFSGPDFAVIVARPKA